MNNTKKSRIKQALAIMLCSAVLFSILPTAVLSVNTLLSLPESVSLSKMDGTPFLPNQELTPGEGFNVNYYYGTVENIDSSIKYPLPSLSNQIEVVLADSSAGVVSFPINNSNDDFLGTLEVDTQTGAMTFQFDSLYDGRIIDDFFLQFSMQLDEDNVEIGEDIKLYFPIKGGTADFDITVVDTEKEPPTVAKSYDVSTDDSPTGHVEILWTVTVTNAANPQRDINIKDSWSTNQEYVNGSFCINGVPVTSGLSLNTDGKGLQYERTNITPGSVDVITYKTRIKSSAFLNNRGIPLTSGNIKCTNTAQAYLPGTTGTALGTSATAAYSHPITWLYKTSGNVINPATGEMEWTITILNNGLGMQNVVLYDRLSPGVSVIEDSANIQIGDGPVQPLANFMRTSETDLFLNSNTNNAYNLVYPLESIGNVTVIKYRTIITNPTQYNAGAHLPPDSIYDNRAFITYQIPSGSTLSSVITSPVVVKSGGYDTGLIGKKGTLEAAYHTIKWTLTVNKDNRELSGAKVADKLTYAAPVSAVPSSVRLCHHAYYDSVTRNNPQYSIAGAAFKAFTPYDADYPNTPFTYKLTPTNGEVYDIEFYLGDISEQVDIVFRSTATDKIIFANNVTNNCCKYENKAALITSGNEFSYATAEVVYKSDVIMKADARSWYNKTEHSYNFDDNQLPWLIRVNMNQMAMTNIVITDTLNFGTSLVPGSMVMSRPYTWYKPEQSPDFQTLPERSQTASKPYYEYDEATRKITISLPDVPASAVGTADASTQILFYVQVDVNHPVFNDPSDPDYIGIANGVWSIPNIAALENNYYSGTNAITERASYGVLVQHMLKSGTAYKNNNSYSIDYSIDINRIQKQFPQPAVIHDTLPAGLRLDASSVHLYEATVASPDMYGVLDNGTNGKMTKGDEIDSQLYSVETTIDALGQTTMRVILPEDCGSKMYILDYSCDVTDINKAPFTNNAFVEGFTQSNSNSTITRIQLTKAGGGGYLRDFEKTTVIATKTDSLTGIAVQGAVFGIYYKGVLLEEKTTDATGKVRFENLNKGFTYTVKELEPAPGYLAPVDVSETFVAAGITTPTTLSFENAPIEGTIQFIKTDEDETALPGAEFGLWRSAADVGVTPPLKTATSQQNGTVTFYELIAGGTYYIAEISAPENYVKSSEVIVAHMALDGSMDKLWLNSDNTETAITSFVNHPTPSTTLIVSKTVDGNMGDRTKAFSFTLNVNTNAGMVAGSVLNGTKTAADGTVTPVTLSVGAPYSFTLAHGETLSVIGLNPGTAYTVSENDYAEEGYTASYITTRNDTASQPQNGRSATGTIASGINTEAFTNTANTTTLTGIFLDFGYYALIVLLAAIGGAILLLKRKKHRIAEY